MAYGRRRLWSRSPDSSQSMGKPCTRRSRTGQQVFVGCFVEVREMLLMNTKNRKAGGRTVTCSLTASWLESRMTRKLACPVRGRAVGKVLKSNSLAAYPTCPRADMNIRAANNVLCFMRVRTRCEGGQNPLKRGVSASLDRRSV